MSNQEKMTTVFEKLSTDDQLMVFHANDILWLWHQLVRQDTDGRGWYERRAREAYQDCLQSLVRYGFIESFDVIRVETKIHGEWYSNRRPRGETYPNG